MTSPEYRPVKEPSTPSAMKHLEKTHRPSMPTRADSQIDSIGRRKLDRGRDIIVCLREDNVCSGLGTVIAPTGDAEFIAVVTTTQSIALERVLERIVGYHGGREDVRELREGRSQPRCCIYTAASAVFHGTQTRRSSARVQRGREPFI